MYYFVSYIIKKGANEIPGRDLIRIASDSDLLQEGSLDAIEDAILKRLNGKERNYIVTLTNLTPLPILDNKEIINNIKTLNINDFGTM